MLVWTRDRIYSPVATITGGGTYYELGYSLYQGYAVTDVAGGTMTVNMIDDD